MQPQLLLPALLVTLLVTARPEKKARKRKLEAEKAANKKALDKARGQTRGNIAVAFVATTEGFEVMLRLLSFCWTAHYMLCFGEDLLFLNPLFQNIANFPEHCLFVAKKVWHHTYQHASLLGV